MPASIGVKLSRRAGRCAVADFLSRNGDFANRVGMRIFARQCQQAEYHVARPTRYRITAR